MGSQWCWVKLVRAHYSASRLAAKIMLQQKQGLIINTTFYDRGKYFQPLSYFLAKNTINHMAYGMGLELREHNIAAIALSPGWMRTEAVVALASDPQVINKSGQTWTVGDLAKEYGFTDVDGRQVPPFQLPSEFLMD